MLALAPAQDTKPQHNLSFELLLSGLSSATTESEVMREIKLGKKAYFTLMRNERTGKSKGKGVLVVGDESTADSLLRSSGSLVINSCKVRIERLWDKGVAKLPSKRPRSRSEKEGGALFERCRSLLLLKSMTLKDCAKKMKKANDYVKKVLVTSLQDLNFFNHYTAKLQSQLKGMKDIELVAKPGTIKREVNRAKRTFEQRIPEIQALLATPFADEGTIDLFALWLSVFDLEREVEVFTDAFKLIAVKDSRALWIDLMQYFPLSSFKKIRSTIEVLRLPSHLLPTLNQALCLSLAKSDNPNEALEMFQELMNDSCLSEAEVIDLYKELFLTLPSIMHQHLISIDFGVIDTEILMKLRIASAQAADMLIDKGLPQLAHNILMKLLDQSSNEEGLLDVMMSAFVKGGFTEEVTRIQNILNPPVQIAEMSEVKDLFAKFTEDVISCLNSSQSIACRSNGCVKSVLRRLVKETRDKLGLKDQIPTEEIVVEEAMAGKRRSHFIYSMRIASTLLYKTDITTGYTWKQETHLDFKDGCQYCEVSEFKLVVTGGYDSDQAIDIDTSSGFELNWLNPMENIRYNHGTCYFEGMVYALGGQYDNKKMRACERLSLALGTWESISPSPEALSCINPICVERLKALFVFGGFNTHYLDAIHKFDIIKNEWTRLEAKMFRKAHYVPCFITKEDALDIYFISQNYMGRLNTSKGKVLDVKVLNEDVYCYQGMSRYWNGSLYCPRYSDAPKRSSVGLLQ